MKIKIGDKIKRIRKMQNGGKGISMEDFGKLFDPPASKGVVSNWENNYNYPNEARLEKIAKLGNTSVKDLLSYDKAPQFGKFIRGIRHDKNLSVQELAEKCELTLSDINDIEEGTKGMPDFQVITLLGEILDIPATVLFVRSGYFGGKTFNVVTMGDKLAQLRKDNNLSIEDLSNKTTLSIDKIKDIERGFSLSHDIEYIPSEDEIKTILNVYNIELDTFFESINITKEDFKKEYELYLSELEAEAEIEFNSSVNHDEQLGVRPIHIDLYYILDYDIYIEKLDNREYELQLAYKDKILSKEDLEKLKQLLEIYFKD